MYYTVAVTAPKAAEGRIEEARELMGLGLSVLKSAHARTERIVRVVFSSVTYR